LNHFTVPVGMGATLLSKTRLGEEGRALLGPRCGPETTSITSRLPDLVCRPPAAGKRNARGPDMECPRFGGREITRLRRQTFVEWPWARCSNARSLARRGPCQFWVPGSYFTAGRSPHEMG